MHAQFTMTLYDAYTKDDTFWDWLDFGDYTEELKNAIIAAWDIYEIAGETINEQKKYMSNTFNQYKDYYKQLIDINMNELYEIMDIKSHSKLQDTGDVKQIHVELPNKQINANDIYAYPNDGTKTDNNLTTETESHDPLTTLRIKKELRMQVKNYYNEFALRFAHDFIHFFGGIL